METKKVDFVIIICQSYRSMRPSTHLVRDAAVLQCQTDACCPAPVVKVRQLELRRAGHRLQNILRVDSLLMLCWTTYACAFMLLHLRVRYMSTTLFTFVSDTPVYKRIRRQLTTCFSVLFLVNFCCCCFSYPFLLDELRNVTTCAAIWSPQFPR